MVATFSRFILIPAYEKDFSDQPAAYTTLLFFITVDHILKKTEKQSALFLTTGELIKSILIISMVSIRFYLIAIS